MAARSALALAILAGIGCAPSMPTPSAPARGQLDPPVFSPGVCEGAKEPLRPMIVEWPATNRAELEASAARGPVVVSYAGCVLKVLSSCRADAAGGYEVEATTPTEDHIDIENVHDLRAALPLGVASLKGKLAEGNRLTLSYVTVGSRLLRQPPAMLHGNCEGATHYISGMALGAFSLAAQRSATREASAQIGGARAGDVTESTEQLGGSAGDLAACRARGLGEGAACQAILGVSLRPLPLVGGQPLAAGFGLGLAAPLALAAVAPLPLAGGDTGSDFARVDVTLLEMLQAALSADRLEELPGAAKADAWDRLTRYAPASRYAGTAAHRRDEWRRHAEAELAREGQIVALCPRYRTDRSKLDRLLHLDRGVLGDPDKEIYKKEFDAAYAPWPEVARCHDLEAAAAVRASWPALHGANDGMVRVHGGAFAMGSTLLADHAAPVHSVTLPDFEIDATEITVEAYARCQRAGACSQRGSYVGDDTWRCNDTHRLTTYGPSGGETKDQAAANCMTFDQAARYCHWAHKRLPTEEEWEYAARGPESRRYPWGEWGTDEGGSPYFPYHYCADPSSSLGYQAGSLATNASPFGARDMAGGVWEWTTSRFAPRYDSAPTSRERVVRGGEFGWSNDADCRPYDAAYRFSHDPAYADSNLGARCAR